VSAAMNEAANAFPPMIFFIILSPNQRMKYIRNYFKHSVTEFWLLVNNNEIISSLFHSCLLCAIMSQNLFKGLSQNE